MATKQKHIGLVRNDTYLEPYEEAIRGRHDHALWKLNQLTKNGKKTVSGHQTPQNSIWWVTSMIGVKR